MIWQWGNSASLSFWPPPPHSFILSSRLAGAAESLRAVLRYAAPRSSALCARIWSRSGPGALRRPRVGRDGASRSGGATAKGDGYDVVDLQWLEGKSGEGGGGNGGNGGKGGGGGTDDPSPTTMSEFLSLHSQHRSLDLIVEVRPTPTSPWPRSSLELGERLRVGDFVDAQDSGRKWYEAVVRDVHPNAVKVHYLGWSGKWDSWVPRRRQGEMAWGGAGQKDSEAEFPSGCLNYALPPAPLWSKTSRWRENVAVGTELEVRESASLMQRPKWFRAEVVHVSTEDAIPREIVGGAELEASEPDLRFGFEPDGVTPRRKRPLLLLGRTRQALVAVPQESFNVSMRDANAPADNPLLSPTPPILSPGRPGTPFRSPSPGGGGSQHAAPGQQPCKGQEDSHPIPLPIPRRI